MWRGEGRWPPGTHCPPRLTPPALRPLLWVWGASAGTCQRGRRGWDGAGAAGPSLSPARAPAVLPGALRGAHHAPDPLPEGAGLGHRVP